MGKAAFGRVATYLSTQEFTDAIGIKTGTAYSNLCRFGHVAGIRPTKLPNRILRWPLDQVARVLRGEKPIALESDA